MRIVILLNHSVTDDIILNKTDVSYPYSEASAFENSKYHLEALVEKLKEELKISDKPKT